jgi:hypothetical protein
VGAIVGAIVHQLGLHVGRKHLKQVGREFAVDEDERRWFYDYCVIMAILPQ